MIMTPVYPGTRDPNIPDHKYLEYAKDFVYIGKLCGEYNDGTKYCASAVAIDDNHILTAAHIVKNSKTCELILDGDKKFNIQNIVYHKDFDKDTFGEADIAIGYSEKEFNLRFYPDLYDKEDEIGKLCCISGFGMTGTFRTGGNKFDNHRRAGSNIVDDITSNLLICSPSSETANNRTSLEFIIASGDSGGGLFIDGKLAGINSCVLASDKNPNSTYGDECGHTRISKFISWILAHKTKQKKP